MKNVTIVIPVYGDWETLKLCIESLKKYTDLRHTVLLVNDHGPEWKEMEDNILKSIEGVSNFKYFLNPENMGFVRTCNRAVTELDKTDNDIFLLNSDTQVTEGFLEEIIEVMYLTEKHGIVCPRSNNATLLTIPVKNGTGTHISDEKSYETFLQMKKILPRFSVIPTGVGFAMLIRRNLITQFGLFDEIYGKGYNEENDFCARVNQYGYNVVMANRAYVYHYESRSFGAAKAELDAKNREILISRYPYYWELNSNYRKYDIDPREYFADLLVDCIYDKPRVLWDISAMDCKNKNQMEAVLALYGSFLNGYGDRYASKLLINCEIDEKYNVLQKFDCLLNSDDISDTFHISLVWADKISIDHLCMVNRVSLKYIPVISDTVNIRCFTDYLDDQCATDQYRNLISYCDRIIGINYSVINDIKNMYDSEFEFRDIPCSVADFNFTDRDSKNESIYSAEQIEKIIDETFHSPVDYKLLVNRWHVIGCVNKLKDWESRLGYIGPELKGMKRIKALRKEEKKIFNQVLSRHTGILFKKK